MLELGKQLNRMTTAQQQAFHLLQFDLLGCSLFVNICIIYSFIIN